jgi:hypothetical protein
MQKLNWKKIYREGFWLGLLVLALLVRAIASPEGIERIYSRGLFLAIRQGLDAVARVVPFPMIYILLLLLLVAAIRSTIRIWRGKGTVLYRTGQTLWSTLKATAALVFFFTLMWGYNYGRVSFEEQAGLEIEPLTFEQLYSQLEAKTTLLLDYRAQIPGADTTALDESFLPEDVENLGRIGLESLLAGEGYPVVGRVRARNLHPKGILLRFNSSGVYLPWTGEGHVDAGLHPLQKPFVMIHEMGHGYGFTDEGTCNFLAVLGGLQCSDPFIRYSVLLGYWRYLASEVRYQDRDTYATFYRDLPAEIKADLRAIHEYQDAYPEFFPRLRYIAYDTYLKAQGIEEGILSYDRVLVLMKAWENTRQRPVF